MKKRIFCLILALVMVLSLAACAGSGNDNTENTKDTTADTTNTDGSENNGDATTPVSGGEAELALITDANSIDDRGFNQFSWEGLKQYAEENGKTYTYYTPIDQSTQSYLSAIEGRCQQRSKLVVTPGFLFGEAIYKAQTMYPDVHFVLVDSTPTLDDDTVIADNTCSIFFAEEQSGFLAGYAAVKEGYRKLGFFGALAVPAVVRYGYGFVDGAEYAAKELGLEAGSIEMKYTYTALSATLLTSRRRLLHGISPAPSASSAAAPRTTSSRPARPPRRLRLHRALIPTCPRSPRPA